MTAWLCTLGPLGLLLLAAFVSVALTASCAAIGIIAWVLSGGSDTDADDAALDGPSDEDPGPGGGNVMALPRRLPSEPPPSEPQRAA